MPSQPNPLLPETDWGTYKVYHEVSYAPAEWNSRHWVCPGCNGQTTVMRNTCDYCFRDRVKKVIGHNRLGNPIERWVMKLDTL